MVYCWTLLLLLCWMGLYVIFRDVGLLTSFCSIFDGKKMLANSIDPDQMPHYVAPVLGLHCLPVTLLWVSR